MADTDTTLAQFQTEVAAVKAALIAEDYATARKKAALASVTRDALFQSMQGAGRSQAFESVNEMLANMLAAIDAYERASQGSVKLVGIQFGRPS